MTAKTNLLARCDAFIEANSLSYGVSTQMTVILVRRVREQLENLTETAAYLTEQAVLAAEVPNQWGERKVNASDLIAFVPAQYRVRVESEDLVIPNCD